MEKGKTVYECQECGYQTPKWQGRCFECGNYGVFKEVKSFPRSVLNFQPSYISRIDQNQEPQVLSEIKTPSAKLVKTHLKEFDRVLGGGLVPGQVILIGGEPGIGKSTLLLQVAASVDQPVLYVSGEESLFQLKSRADRLGIHTSTLQVTSETELEKILKRDLSIFSLLVIDSIQAIFTSHIDSAAGSILQTQECTRKLVYFAKNTNAPVIIVGHVTKEGRLAGPKQLEHLVDTVLHLDGERQHDLRILRSFKNRFGPVNETGIFRITGGGLKSIDNLALEFLARRRKGVPGSVATLAFEGRRPLPLEIQALTVPSYYGYPRRTVTGIGKNRLEMLLAVLQKRAGLKFGNFDVYVNVSGGFKVQEPAIDLAVVLALASSLKDKPVEENVLAVGEVGLLGEVKWVSQLDDRIKEGKRLGFDEVLSSKSVSSVRDAINRVLNR